MPKVASNLLTIFQVFLFICKIKLKFISWPLWFLNSTWFTWSHCFKYAFPSLVTFALLVVVPACFTTLFPCPCAVAHTSVCSPSIKCSSADWSYLILVCLCLKKKLTPALNMLIANFCAQFCLFLKLSPLSILYTSLFFWNSWGSNPGLLLHR